MRVRAIALILFALLLLVGPSFSVSAQQPTPSSQPLTELPEKDLNTELKSARGLPFKLSDYSGRVLVINLWATWCGPCLMEVPTLVKLQSDLWSQGVRVVGLSTENPTDSRREVQQFIRVHRIQYKIGWASQDVATTLMQGRDAVPQTYVISGSGRIVRRFVGFNPTVSPGLVREAVAEAQKENVPSP
ncbi:MAG TPA: TlpA disulfide reductase family protein [Pyrinomonadaceae bacterium]|nr:TlpA disulfide reductase family protein [Pyrinomonadaceae bacterium]